MIETVQVSWLELVRRTWRQSIDDDVLGLAAQLSFYFFLALFPAILLLLPGLLLEAIRVALGA